LTEAHAITRPVGDPGKLERIRREISNDPALAIGSAKVRSTASFSMSIKGTVPHRVRISRSCRLEKRAVRGKPRAQFPLTDDAASCLGYPDTA
jgi:hypothetical protein